MENAFGVRGGREGGRVRGGGRRLVRGGGVGSIRYQFIGKQGGERVDQTPHLYMRCNDTGQ